MKRTIFNIQTTEEFKARVEAEAKRRGITLSSLIKEAISKEIDYGPQIKTINRKLLEISKLLAKGSDLP